MARAKRASDEIYNARRRAKRLIARLEREDVSGMSALQRSARADYIASLQKHIQASYQPRGKVTSQVKQAVKAEGEQLNRMTSQPRGAKNAMQRSNAVFERQINLARIGSPSALGDVGEVQVQVFYAATRKIWRGRDMRRRNEYIMRALGTDSLEEAFKKVLRENRRAFKIAAGKSPVTSYVEGLTSENEDFYNEVEMDAEGMGSAVWASYLTMFN